MFTSTFNSSLSNEEKSVTGAEQVGMIRTMADFSKAAYLNHSGATANSDIIITTAAYNEVISHNWTPLTSLNIPSLSSTLNLNDGFYTNDNASAFVARYGDDTIVLSFCGTDTLLDKLQWPNMASHYALFSDLITAFDQFVTDNHISNVYVTGHSMGGAMALEYMSQHSGNQYQAVTFAAPPFTDNVSRKDYAHDSRILQIEIAKDPVPMVFDINNYVLDPVARPGQADGHCEQLRQQRSLDELFHRDP